MFPSVGIWCRGTGRPSPGLAQSCTSCSLLSPPPSPPMSLFLSNLYLWLFSLPVPSREPLETFHTCFLWTRKEGRIRRGVSGSSSAQVWVHEARGAEHCITGSCMALHALPGPPASGAWLRHEWRARPLPLSTKELQLGSGRHGSHPAIFYPTTQSYV